MQFKSTEGVHSKTPLNRQQKGKHIDLREQSCECNGTAARIYERSLSMDNGGANATSQRRTIRGSAAIRDHVAFSSSHDAFIANGACGLMQSFLRYSFEILSLPVALFKLPTSELQFRSSYVPACPGSKVSAAPELFLSCS